MSTEFWAVFFGSFLGLFSVNAIQAAIDEYRAKIRHRNLHILLQQMEDAEYGEDEEE